MNYKNMVMTSLWIFSSSCMVPVFGTQMTDETQSDEVAQDSSAAARNLRHRAIQEWKTDNKAAAMEAIIARITAESRNRVAIKTAQKLQQRQNGKKVRKSVEIDPATTEPVEVNSSIAASIAASAPALPAAESRVVRAQEKDNRRQQNKACSTEERAQKSRDALSAATTKQAQVDAEAQAQGIDKNELIQKGRDALAQATTKQAQIDAKAQQLGIDKNETIQKSQAMLAQATAKHNEVYN